MAKRVLFVNDAGKWSWHLKANNNRIVATDGSQGYENLDDARAMADRIIGGEFKDADKRIIRPEDE